MRARRPKKRRAAPDPPLRPAQSCCSEQPGPGPAPLHVHITFTVITAPPARQPPPPPSPLPPRSCWQPPGAGALPAHCTLPATQLPLPAAGTQDPELSAALLAEPTQPSATLLAEPSSQLSVPLQLGAPQWQGTLLSVSSSLNLRASSGRPLSRVSRGALGGRSGVVQGGAWARRAQGGAAQVPCGARCGAGARGRAVPGACHHCTPAPAHYCGCHWWLSHP